jgi:hypothetical protein
MVAPLTNDLKSDSPSRPKQPITQVKMESVKFPHKPNMLMTERLVNTVIELSGLWIEGIAALLLFVWATDGKVGAAVATTTVVQGLYCSC